MPSKKPLVLMGPVTLASSSQHMKGISMTTGSRKDGEDFDASNASEYLSLIDTAARLSTYLLNRDAPPLPSSFPNSHPEVDNVRQEAELLLKFMTSKIPGSSSDLSESDESIDSNSTNPLSSISPSLSFESRRYSHGPIQRSLNTQKWASSTVESRKRSQRQIEEHFSLNCPALSLAPNTSNEEVVFPIPSPASLLARSMVTCDSADISVTAEALATNALNSFIDAINWRARIWIKSLSKVLVLREKLESSKMLKITPKNTSSTEHTEDDPDNNDEGDNPKAKVKDEAKKSCEVRVIQAIAQALSCIAVHDIRTTFHVLEKHALEKPLDEKYLSEYCASVTVPHKKRRREIGKVNPSDQRSCTLSHALKVEFKCTVSTSNNRLDIVLQAPGAINGKFLTKDGNINLSQVNVMIDTAALAESMEKNSRLVVQTAAKQQILCPSGSEDDIDSVNSSTHIASLDSTGSHDDWSDTEEEKYQSGYHSPKLYDYDELNVSKVTPKTADKFISFPGSVLVTPMNHEPNSNSSSDSEMPPPPPRLPDEFPMPTVEKKVSFKINPRRVSPSLTSLSNVDNDVDMQSLEDELNSPKGVKPMIPSTVFDAIGTETNVVSPHPSNNVNICASVKLAELNCPSLPILAEVACAASIV